MSSVATRARSHYRNQQRIALAGVRAVRTAVKAAATPTEASAAATTTLATYQLASALNGARTMAVEAGRDLLVDPTAFAGTTQLGWPVETPLSTILGRTWEQLQREAEEEVQRLTDELLASLDLFVESEIIAAGADAASVEIAAGSEFTLYVRVLDLPSCDRCAILAGRIYRDLDGFARHPKCDCQHWPVDSLKDAEAAGLVADPTEAFERGQVTGLSKADAQAIRDGADISAIVNAKRAGRRYPPGMTNAVTLETFRRTVKATTAGTTKRSEWRRRNPNLPIRLRPESIYAHAADRADALRLLRLYGYLA